MLSRGISALSLLKHVPYLEGKDRETVDSPGRRFSVDGCIRQNLHILIELAEIGVDILYHISTVLVRLINATLEHKSILRVDIWVANDVLKMPLNSVYPALVVEGSLYGASLERILDRGLDIVFNMVVGNSLSENVVGFLCKHKMIFLLKGFLQSY